MTDNQIERIANAEYYGDKQLAHDYKIALKRIKGMIFEKDFEYKDPDTRYEKNWEMPISLRIR